MKPPPSEPGPPDEPSRKELERLEKILAGERWRLVVARLARGAIPVGILFCFLVLSAQSLSYTSPLPYLIGSQLCALLISGFMIYFSVWPRYQLRAAAIRSGSSYAAPAEWKDFTIFQWSAVALMLIWFAIQYHGSTDAAGAVAGTFYIASVVMNIWAVGKAVLGYRRCPPAHVRREELGKAIFIALAILFLFVFAAKSITRVFEIRNSINRLQQKLSPPNRAP